MSARHRVLTALLASLLICFGVAQFGRQAVIFITPTPKSGHPEQPKEKPKPTNEEPQIDQIAEKLQQHNKQDGPSKTDTKYTPQPPNPQKGYAFNASDTRALLDKRDPTRQSITGLLINSNNQLTTSAGATRKLTTDWVGELHKRITDCWTIPSRVRGADELEVRIAIRLKPDGTLQDHPQLTGAPRGTSDPAFAESAIRAIEQCQPYLFLPQAEYKGGWEYIEFDLSTLGLFLLAPSVGAAAYAKSHALAPPASAKQKTASWLPALVKRISDCWSVPAGVRDAEPIQVRIKVRLGPNGMLQQPPEVVEATQNSTGLSFAQSAIHAIEQCQPYNFLPEVEYRGGWDFMDMTFSPRDLMSDVGRDGQNISQTGVERRDESYAQAPDQLTRQMAADAIRSYLAAKTEVFDEKLLVPVTLTCNATMGCIGIRTRARDETEIHQLGQKIEQLITATDQDYTNAIRQVRRGDGDIRYRDVLYDALTDHWGTMDQYRKLWQSGLIEGFQWRVGKTPHWGDLNLTGVGILKNELQQFCLPNYTAGQYACKVIASKQTLESVTGIRAGNRNDELFVEFIIRDTPTQAGQTLFGRKESLTSHLASFVRYDDGWRLQAAF